MIIATTAKHLTLYSAWFCPYAQRVWCALNELGLPYQLVESLEIDPVTEAYVKNPDLVKYNPKGLVPTLVLTDIKTKDTQVYCDSLDVLKVLYEKDDHDTATQQLYEEAKDWNQRICSKFYKVLMQQNEQECHSAWKEMCQAMSEFANQLGQQDDGAFYKGATTPSLVDLAVFPFIHRLYIVEHYKGLNFSAESSSAVVIDEWRQRMEARPAIMKTLAPRDKLIPIYLRYSDGTAKSKVADAVRQGSEAHTV